MRAILVAALAVLLAASPAAADDYGEQLCKQYMPPGTPCACVAPILEEEFDEDELEPLMQFLRSFMDGLKGDEAAAQKTIDRIAAKHGKKTIEEWLAAVRGPLPGNRKDLQFQVLEHDSDKSCPGPDRRGRGAGFRKRSCSNNILRRPAADRWQAPGGCSPGAHLP